MSVTVRRVETKSRFVGKWFQLSNRGTFILNADGTATTSFDDDTGKWQANGEGTAIEVRWGRGGWLDVYRLEGRKWVKYAYQNGVHRGTDDITPP